jgi:hypothetical protein
MFSAEGRAGSICCVAGPGDALCVNQAISGGEPGDHRHRPEQPRRLDRQDEVAGDVGVHRRNPGDVDDHDRRPATAEASEKLLGQQRRSGRCGSRPARSDPGCGSVCRERIPEPVMGIPPTTAVAASCHYLPHRQLKPALPAHPSSCASTSKELSEMVVSSLRQIASTKKRVCLLPKSRPASP